MHAAAAARGRGLSKSIVVVVIFVPQGRAALEGERERERERGKEGERERRLHSRKGRSGKHEWNGSGVGRSNNKKPTAAPSLQGSLLNTSSTVSGFGLASVEIE